jgi:hypothetical protein
VESGDREGIIAGRIPYEPEGIKRCPENVTKKAPDSSSRIRGFSFGGIHPVRVLRFSVATIRRTDAVAGVRRGSW